MKPSSAKHRATLYENVTPGLAQRSSSPWGQEVAVWKQSPICHLPVIYLFGLVTGVILLFPRLRDSGTATQKSREERQEGLPR